MVSIGCTPKKKKKGKKEKRKESFIVCVCVCVYTMEYYLGIKRRKSRYL